MSTITNQELQAAFLELSTPLVTDACLRLGLPVRVAHLRNIGGAVED